MKLNTISIVTDNVAELRDFYSSLLKIEYDPTNNSPLYFEFQINQLTKLAFFSSKYEQELGYGEPSIVRSNRNVWLEFQVDDIDAEFVRIKLLNVELIGELSVKPWGNKSFYFRDPDGNPISFYQQGFNNE